MTNIHIYPFSEDLEFIKNSLLRGHITIFHTKFDGRFSRLEFRDAEEIYLSSKGAVSL